MRRPLIVANWKMNKTTAEAAAYMQRLEQVLDPQSIDVVVAPPFTALYAARQARSNVAIGLAAQDVFWEDKGAFTGEVSPPMLTDLGCRFVIIGHSERRQWFGEDDAAVNKKVRAAIRHGLRPIVCVGETLADREGGSTQAVVGRQVDHGLESCAREEVQTIAIAYEPVWAIGTGRAATPAQATEVHAFLRRKIASRWGASLGESIRILYGGSVTVDNAPAFLSSPDVDGVLVGGACLDPDGFATIARSAERVLAREG